MHARKFYENVSFCEEWRDYSAFEKWAFDHGWQKGMVLTRRDKSGNFTPNNCFWATRAEANGWRSVVHRLPDGRRVRDLIGNETLGKDREMHHRITVRLFNHGWNIDDAVNKPANEKHLRFLPDCRTLREAIGKDIDEARYCLIADRVFRLGWSLEKAMSIGPIDINKRARDKRGCLVQ